MNFVLIFSQDGQTGSSESGLDIWSATRPVIRFPDPCFIFFPSAADHDHWKATNQSGYFQVKVLAKFIPIDLKINNIYNFNHLSTSFL